MRYSYVVDDIEHESQQTWVAHEGYGRGAPEREKRRYSALVSVYYDPADPSDSVVAPGRRSYEWIWMIFLGWMVGVAGVVLLPISLSRSRFA